MIDLQNLAQPLYVTGWVLVGGVALVFLGALLSRRRRSRALAHIHSKELTLLEERIESIRQERQKKKGQAEGWAGFANFTVTKKVPHGESGICSFYLRPKDRRLKLPSFHPGQHLVFQLPVEGQSQPVTRRYSLSDAPDQGHYRISVKLNPAPRDMPEVPPGLGSSFLHQKIEDKSVSPSNSHLLVAAPQGSFYLKTMDMRPVVLIGGGVGVTPMLSAFNAILEHNTEREVWFFYGVGNSSEDILFEDGILHPQHLDLVQQFENLNLQVCYSRPLERDTILLESQPHLYRESRVNIGLLKEALPSNNYQFFICGPDTMMDQLEDDLVTWGVPEDDVYTERFGPPKKKAAAGAESAKLSFTKSGKEATFEPEDGFILDTAEKASVPIANDCRAGSCGSCEVTIVSGNVKYPRKPSFRCAPNKCLTCCTIPDGDLALDC